MKLVMTLLVRDEEDILRENIEFHLESGVDEIVLMDNLSTDGTADIAADYARAGVLHYIFQPEDDYSQGRWVTSMARYAAEKLGADWIINNDADEFWWPAKGSLKDALLQTGSHAMAASAERTNFLPRSKRGGAFWQRMDVRYNISTNSIGKLLPGKVAHRALIDIEVAQGNHSVSRAGRSLDAEPAAISILHFPIRSQEQFTNKIAKGGAAYARNKRLDHRIGITWRTLYAQYLDGDLEQEFAKSLLSEEAIEQGVLSGDLLMDFRLKTALESLHDRRLSVSLPPANDKRPAGKPGGLLVF